MDLKKETKCSDNSKVFKLESKSIIEGEMIDNKFTPQGVDYNPEITWNKDDIPSNTKSFAFAVEDPDAPNGLWLHWLVINIPAFTNKIEEHLIPGEEIKNSWKISKYKGPSPPKGQKHRYYYKLFALSEEKISAKSIASFYEQVNKYKIGEGSIMGYYSK